jgi:hypothetical protein
MLYDKFIRLVEDHAEELTKEWIKEIKSNPSTAGYRNVEDAILGKRIFDVYRRLGEWVINADPNDPKTAEHFIKLGRERAIEKLKNSEVIYALILARVVLWRYIVEHEVITSSIELHQSLEFYQKVNNFFDKAAYFVAVGFENINKEDQEKLKKEDFVGKAVQGVTGWFINQK